MAFTNNLTAFTAKATEMLVKDVIFTEVVNGGFKFYGDVQYKKTIPVPTSTLYDLSAQCSLTSSGGTVMNEIELQTYGFAWQIDYCFEDFVTSTLSIPEPIATEFSDDFAMVALTQENMLKVKQRIWYNVWAGAQASGNIIDGFGTLAFAAASRTLIDSSLTGLTQAQIATGSTVDNIFADFASKIITNSTLYANIQMGKTAHIFASPYMVDLLRQHYLNTVGVNVLADTTGKLAANSFWLPGYTNMIAVTTVPELDVTNRALKPKIFATVKDNLAVVSSMKDASGVSNPVAKWEQQPITNKVFFTASMRLGAKILDTAALITNY